MKSFMRVGLVLLILGSERGALAQIPERQILGIRLGMTEEKAHERLNTLGTLVRKEEKRQEVWQIRDASFSHLIVGFNKDEKVRYVTAVAREDKDAKRVPYDYIGDLTQARQAGDLKINNFNYQWDLAVDKEKADPHTLVMAIGRDAKFLSTYSLKNLDDILTDEDKD